MAAQAMSRAGLAPHRAELALSLTRAAARLANGGGASSAWRSKPRARRSLCSCVRSDVLRNQYSRASRRSWPWTTRYTALTTSRARRGCSHTLDATKRHAATRPSQSAGAASASPGVAACSSGGIPASATAAAPPASAPAASTVSVLSCVR
eukprot:scaffold11629_cov131-Isochrysis_galbana.AAC.9